MPDRSFFRCFQESCTDHRKNDIGDECAEADTMRNRTAKKNWISFIIACLFVAVYGYNRIHMTNHFLSDVCFGTLITYIIFAVISTAFLKAAEK